MLKRGRISRIKRYINVICIFVMFPVTDRVDSTYVIVCALDYMAIRRPYDG